MNDELEEYSLDVSDGRRRAHGRAHDRDAKGTTPRLAAVTGLATAAIATTPISPIEEEKMQPKAAHRRGTERHSKLLISRFHNYHVMLYSCIFLNL